MSNIAASVFEHAVAINKSDSPGDDPAAENQGFAGLYCTVAGSLKIQDGAIRLPRLPRSLSV